MRRSERVEGGGLAENITCYQGYSRASNGTL